MTLGAVMLVGAAVFTYSVVLYHLGYKAGRIRENAWLKVPRRQKRRGV